MGSGWMITENHFAFLRMQKIIIKFKLFYMIKQERSLSKLVIKQSFLNPLKGMYKYLTANMIFYIEILKAKHLK